MNDIENVVFNTVATALRAAFTGIFVTGEMVEVPARFPCAVIEQSDSTVYQRMQDDSLTENQTSLMFTVNVFSNLSSGKKAQAKSIMSVVDDAMRSMKFTRTMCSPVANADRSIFRLTARYAAIAAAGVVDGDTITHQMYRR